MGLGAQKVFPELLYGVGGSCAREISFAGATFA